MAIKDYLIEFNAEAKNMKVNRANEKKLAKLEIEEENEIDLILRRTTSSTDKRLAIIVSQNQFYIQNLKTEEITLVENRDILDKFMSNTDITTVKFKKLQWARSFEKNKTFIDEVVKIIKNERVREFYRYGIFDSLSIAGNELFNKDKKLFKYLYNLKKAKVITGHEFNDLCPIVNIINEMINHNNAIYFIDTFVEAKSLNPILDIRYYGGYDATTIYLCNLVNNNNCDFKTLINYIFIELPKQGLYKPMTAFRDYYKDYVDMCTGLYGKVKNKYPKNLITEHDKVAMIQTINYKFNKELMIFNGAKRNKELEYSNDKFFIRIVDNSADLIDGALELHNCLATYITRVAKGTSIILFMCEKSNPDGYYMAIEIDSARAIIQAKKEWNKTIRQNSEEYNFIEEWAKAKKLSINFDFVVDKN